MTTDLWMLVATALLAAAIPLVYAAGRFQVPGGFRWAFGNREAPLTGVPEWAQRTVRAHANLTENIAGFAILVLVAAVAGKANEMTALGAQLFFWGRVAHLGLYTAGVTYLRTVAFFVAAAGEVLILIQLF
ncbi:MAG TPA: MAPEG family protein [Nevskiaceae bacterium]|nr:MAPEG family protein [Nevskiaceae bacterium]